VILRLYSVYDKKALLFGQPNFMLNDQVAIRSFTDGVKDTGSTIGKHPEDYALYHIATYNEVNGSIKPEDPPAMIGDGITFVTPTLKEA